MTTEALETVQEGDLPLLEPRDVAQKREQLIALVTTLPATALVAVWNLVDAMQEWHETLSSLGLFFWLVWLVR